MPQVLKKSSNIYDRIITVVVENIIFILYIYFSYMGLHNNINARNIVLYDEIIEKKCHHHTLEIIQKLQPDGFETQTI